MEFADDTRTRANRKAIDAFLYNALAPNERENIKSYFISDEATIFDRSMDMPATWIANCRAAYNVDISNQVRMPLWELISWVEEQVGNEQSTK